jgi:hypothetical protein
MDGVRDLYFREIVWDWVLEGGIKTIDRWTTSTMNSYSKPLGPFQDEN